MAATASTIPRKLFTALGVSATVAILATVALLWLWRRAFADVERYFQDQAVERAEYLRGRLAEEWDAFIASAQGSTWRTAFPETVSRRLEHELRARFELLPQELVFFVPEQTARGWVETPLTLYGRQTVDRATTTSWLRVGEFRLDVKTAENDPAFLVRLAGDVAIRGASEAADRPYGMWVAYAFPKLGVLERSRVHLMVLLGVFLTMLYGILIAVYVMGRRESRLAFRAQQKEIRLRAMASVAEGIAHDVRNPLNAVSLLMQYLERLPLKTGATPMPQDFQMVYVELGKIRKVIDNFVVFAKLREIELSEWDLGELLEGVLARFAPVFTQEGIEVERSSEGRLLVNADRDKMQQVLHTILSNAVEVLRPVAERRLSIRLDGRRNDVRLAFRDSGPRPDDKTLQTMFEPYAAQRASALGLGLTIAKTVVESHAGSIDAAAPEGGGCVITIVLPRR